MRHPSIHPRHFSFALLLFLTPTLASAGIPISLSIGNSDQLQQLMPVAMKGKDGETLTLGYRTTKVVFGLGLYIKNQGYVLVPTDGSNTYYPLDESAIAKMQQEGLLPRELPDHSLPISEYLTGYSLWIAIAIAALYVKIAEVRAHKTQSLKPVGNDDA